MSSRAQAFAAVLILAVATVSPAVAGEVWSAPVEGCRIALPFGERYAGKTHRGVDLVADAGADVRAPSSGVVTFAGTVPADGGGTCGAVTVELADGLRVSLLPLAEVFVEVGDRVAAAETVGVLAAAGDDSCSVAHLHLGARRGTAYVDPTGFLPVAVVDTPETTGEAVPGVVEPVGATPPAVPASVTEPGGTGAQVAGTPQVSAAGATAEVPASSASAFSDTVRRPLTATGMSSTRDTHAIPEDAALPAPSELARPLDAGSALTWSLPVLAATGGALPAAAAAIAAFGALAGPRLRAVVLKAQ